jgi:hypothetical protein
LSSYLIPSEFSPNEEIISKLQSCISSFTILDDNRSKTLETQLKQLFNTNQVYFPNNDQPFRIQELSAL